MRDLRPRVVAAVEHEFGGNVFAAQARPAAPRACGTAGGRSRRQRPPTSLSRCLRRGTARLGHHPVARQQVGRPAVIAQGGEGRVLGHRRAPAADRRSRNNDRSWRTPARCSDSPADASPAVAFRPAVHALAGKFDAAAAVLAIDTAADGCTCRFRCGSAARPRAVLETAVGSPPRRRCGRQAAEGRRCGTGRAHVLMLPRVLGMAR